MTCQLCLQVQSTHTLLESVADLLVRETRLTYEGRSAFAPFLSLEAIAASLTHSQQAAMVVDGSSI
ncbi:MAG: hypothetical protein GY924_17935 [Planctomycetaceae bacterium]|nr:hypothetical protein [Planctomycetaceae bacterium]